MSDEDLRKWAVEQAALMCREIPDAGEFINLATVIYEFVKATNA